MMVMVPVVLDHKAHYIQAIRVQPACQRRGLGSQILISLKRHPQSIPHPCRFDRQYLQP
jgi:ribosomal protein S18 acetylase RimI-like enzyme